MRVNSTPYNLARADVSSGDNVAYFATPTMVNTLLKCGLSPKMPTVCFPLLLAFSSS